MNNSITINPSRISGEVMAPPSKSETHRAILAASLAKGKSNIHHVILSEDIQATIRAVESFGVKTSYKNNTLTVISQGVLPSSNQTIDCHESGSTLRFIIPLFSLKNQRTTITGRTSLMRRPLNIYEDIFNNEGFLFEKNDHQLIIQGALKPKTYQIPGDVSSQFITGLMFALPLLESNSTIIITGDFESKNYVTLTIEVLRKFGINIESQGQNYHIKGQQVYRPMNYKISGDYSQAANFLVAGLLSNRLSVMNLRHDSIQADQAIVNFIKQAGGDIQTINNGYLVKQSSLIGSKFNIQDCPDIGPIIALMCSLAEGTSVITGTSRLRIKESDRIESTVQVLSTLGAKIHTENDDIIIEGVSSLNGGVVDSFNDHRIAMMASIASLVATSPIIITHPMAINKSYPHFYDDLEAVGVIIKRGESNENN